MSHERFTPGPWEALNKFWVVNSRGVTLARLALDDFDAEANARLIAAAPDLLEALQMIVTAVDDGAMVSMTPARAAIHKALGQTNMSHEMGDK